MAHRNKTIKLSDLRLHRSNSQCELRGRLRRRNPALTRASESKSQRLCQQTQERAKLHGDTRSQHGWAQTQWDISKIVIACLYPQKRWNMRFVTNCMGTPDHSTVGHKHNGTPTKWSEHASIHKRRSTRLVTKLNGDARSGQRPQNKHATRIERKHKGTPTKWS